MKFNIVNLSTGSRVFIIEDFFVDTLYNDIVRLFNEYTVDNQDWFEDPVYSHAYHGRIVYRGTDPVIDKLTTLASDDTAWICQQLGKKVEFSSLSLWLDLPGYQIPAHYDQPHFEHAVQIYVPEHKNFWEMLGTCVYTDNNHHDPLFEINYRPNRGYLIDRTDTVKHGLNHSIPEPFRRQSVYLRYIIK